MTDYFVRLIALPYHVHGFTMPNDDGTYSVYINSLLSPRAQRAALETFDRLLSKGPIGVDAVVFNDDYLAAGALSAFDRHGVRMPEDVRLATLSNYGLGPVHFRPLTRIVSDPIRHGREIAENLLKMLDGEDVPQQMKLKLTFKAGESA